MVLSVSMNCGSAPWPLRLSELNQSYFAEKSPVSPHPVAPPRSRTDARPSRKAAPSRDETVYSAWKQSRSCGTGEATLIPGAQRPLSQANAHLALIILRACAPDMSRLFCSVQPWRTAAVVVLNVVRGLFPAFKGFSQALILDELQSLTSSDHFTLARLARLLVGELARMALEGVLDSVLASNEAVTRASARFTVEHQLFSRRAHLDAPALADPTVRDLLQESELFVGSFSSTGGMGVFSPLEAIRMLSLISELLAHVYILFSLTRSSAHVGLLVLSLVSHVLPVVDLRAWLGLSERSREFEGYTAAESESMERQLRMRNLVYGDAYRAELMLFGLSDWVTESWASARRAMLGIEEDCHQDGSEGLLSAVLAHVNVSGFSNVLQNLPFFLALRSPTSTFGEVALYRNSIHSVVFSARALAHTIQTGFSAIFLMGAFCAAVRLEPHLKPSASQEAPYCPASGGGMKIEARGLTFTYPGAKEPALKGVNFVIEAGQSVAIVGCNGSGKSTLANLILRLNNFDSGLLLINGTDIRRLDPAILHERSAAVLQGYVRYQDSAAFNVGVGRVQDMKSQQLLNDALARAGAEQLVQRLPHGISTQLDGTGSGPRHIPGLPQHEHGRHGLSGGEWQRIAIARAFMRASRPDVDLLLLDEPTSALDGHAQNAVFQTIEQLSRSPTGERTKTVVFITHRLATARRADRILMLEHGMVTDFGSHEELMARDGPYASLYRASV